MIEKLKNNQGFWFALIGALNTLLDFAILFILKSIGLSLILANIYSTTITFIISFFLNKKITFKSETKNRREIVREVILFTIVTLFGLWVIQNIIISIAKPIIIHYFGGINILFVNISQDNFAILTSKIIGTIFSLIWNFILYKKVIFKK
mgnify:CR=1 FL=1